MRYVVTVGARTFQVEVDGERVVVDGVVCRGELRTLEGTPLRILRLDQRSWSGPMAPIGRGLWELSDGGERVEVEVLDERAAHIRSLAGAPSAAPGLRPLIAPMPGLVTRVLVAPGQEVSDGQGLLVLEAMKMENELKARGPGRVETVPVSIGQAVEKGAILLTFEPWQSRS
jgi:pyruvate carboxylase subunit B